MVQNSIVQSRTYVTSGLPVPSKYAESYTTIDEIFLMLESAVKDGSPPFAMEFDRTLGFPSHYALGDPATDAPEYSIAAFAALSP